MRRPAVHFQIGRDFQNLPVYQFFSRKTKFYHFTHFFPKPSTAHRNNPICPISSSPLGPTPIYRLPEMKVGLQSDVPKIIPRPYAPHTPITYPCYPLPTPTRTKPHTTYDFTFLKKYDII